MFINQLRAHKSWSGAFKNVFFHSFRGVSKKCGTWFDLKPAVSTRAATALIGIVGPRRELSAPLKYLVHILIKFKSIKRFFDTQRAKRNLTPSKIYVFSLLAKNMINARFDWKASAILTPVIRTVFHLWLEPQPTQLLVEAVHFSI